MSWLWTFNLFGIDLQLVQHFLTFRQMLLLLFWGIWTVSRLYFVFVEVGRVAVARQLLKGQQTLVRFNFRNCDWLSERSFLSFTEEVPGERQGISSWNHGTCERSLPGLNLLEIWYDRQGTPVRDGDVLGNDLQLVPSFLSESLLLDVPGTATEQVPTCAFRKSSSSLGNSPKMRYSVRLNSRDSLLVTLLSIFPEPWVMYSSVIP